MARTLTRIPADKLVGRNVYCTGQPRNAGLIINAKPRTPWPFAVNSLAVRVAWLSGEETDANLCDLRALDGLISESKRKLKTHQTTLEKLEVLRRKYNLQVPVKSLAETGDSTNHKRYEAVFTPQVWHNNRAHEVDPKGPTEWDCTAAVNDPANADYFNTKAREEISKQEGGWIDLHDILRDDPAAPAWVREWAGPFTITVTELPAKSEEL